MINADRIVPVMATDLLSLYALIVKMSGKTLTVQNASTTDGQFEVTTGSASTYAFASEPVGTMDFASGVTAANIYFVPAFDYSGFTINGAAVTTSGDTVVPDGNTLYLAALASGGVTITKVGF